MRHPTNFLNVIFHEPGAEGDDLSLCAGFERGSWRNDQLAAHIIKWLPEFALSHSERNEIGAENAVEIIQKAARLVYQTHKYGNRGEFGEILLHIAIRQVFETIPAISKIYYKSAINKTVEGFDAVHIVRKDDELELWIGETKFYNDVDRAISDVCKEIVAHLQTDYLRSEFILIKNKLDPTWASSPLLAQLLNENVSLDTIFSKACIPVLLTYNSDVVNNTKLGDQTYLDNIKIELGAAFAKMRKTLGEKYSENFKSKLPVTVHVILVPMQEKKTLIRALDLRLKALQV